MNFFESQLRRLFGDTEDARFIGRCCFIPADDGNLVKAEFVTQGVHEEYVALQMSVINRADGVMSKKTTTITMVVVALLTLAIVATVIIFAVKNGRQPENPVEPSTDITTPTEKPDDPDPVIPPIDSDSGTETDKPENGKSADITIDVVRPKDDPHEDTPGVVGDVVIQPGIKEGEE